MTAQALFNVLPDVMFRKFVRNCKRASYRPWLKEDGTEIFISSVGGEVDEILTNAVRESRNRKIRNLYSFVRLNTSLHDTQFRVHADSELYGELPNLASVFYLEPSFGDGTALYRHPDYGDRPKTREHQIITKDDGRWSPYFKFEPEANSMLIYDAQLYHGRFPWCARGDNPRNGRIVVVKFMHEYE